MIPARTLIDLDGTLYAVSRQFLGTPADTPPDHDEPANDNDWQGTAA